MLFTYKDEIIPETGEKEFLSFSKLQIDIKQFRLSDLFKSDQVLD